MATTLKEMEELAQTISADNDGLWLGDWPDDYLGHIAGYIGRLESQLEQLRERQRVAQDGRRDEGEGAHREQPLNDLVARSETASRETAWLIEKGGNGAITYWLGQDADSVSKWTADANNAIRFARKYDAEAMIRLLDDSPPPKATEHIFGFAVRTETRAPIDMLLFCPRCGKQHIDAPLGDWTNPPHATHTCQHCGLLWRPSNDNTNGVMTLPVLEEKHAARIEAAIPSAARTETATPDVHVLLGNILDQWECTANDCKYAPGMERLNAAMRAADKALGGTTK